MKANILLLPGDGVGPEVTAAARSVLERIARDGGYDFSFDEALVGGCAIDEHGVSLPPDTLRACKSSSAILLGAVGGPKWSDPTAPVRPEQGLLELRAELGLFANLRPVPTFAPLRNQVPLRAELLEGVDLFFIRELTGGIYFGERQEKGDHDHAFDTMIYSTAEVERVAHVAFRAARKRRKKVTSVDKANVLASMRLWRQAVVAVADQYPDVELEHQLVDAMAMHILTRPADFDVIVAGNMFGDILSDEAAVLAGSLGMLPSASVGEGSLGLYEPIHGSAPDIAGKGIANPIATILSAAMLLRYSLDLDEDATRIEAAVNQALEDGLRTADLVQKGERHRAASTVEATAAILQTL